MRRSRSFALSAVLMGVIILLSKIMGLLRDVLIAGAWGTTAYAVAYETASKLPLTVFDFVLGGVVTAAFIPVYSSVLVKKGREEALSFTSSYINLMLIVTGIMTLVGEVFAPFLVSLIAPGLESGVSSLAVSLTRIMFPMVIFVSLAFSLVGFLQSEGEYNLPAVISLVSNVIMIVYLFFLREKFGVYGLSAAMLIGWGAQALIQVPKARSLGLRYKFRSPVNTPEIRRAAKNALPILLSTWVTPLCTLVNTRLASGIENGRAISALGYANKLYIIIVGLFSFVATNLLFPYFARAAAEGEKGEAERLTRSSVKILVFIIAPISVGVFVLSSPLISLIYERGTFTSSDTALTASALGAYACGMIFAAVNEVLSKAFFAAEKNVYPMISSAVSAAVNIAAVAALSGSGILSEMSASRAAAVVALISSGVTAVNMTVNLIFAVRAGLFTPKRADVRDILVSAVSALIMGGGIKLFTVMVEGGLLMTFIVPIFIGIALYAVCVTLMRSGEMLSLIGAAKKKLGLSRGGSDENDTK